MKHIILLKIYLDNVNITILLYVYVLIFFKRSFSKPGLKGPYHENFDPRFFLIYAQGSSY
jgi:hypothetical protein